MKGGRGKNPARRVAANMLAGIFRGKTLDDVRDRLQDLSDQDRNLADAMVQISLRHHGSLQKILKSYVKKMPPRASTARALLFIGAAQLLHMNVPTHAAIHETVAATGRREQPYRGMINAVLRNLARAQEADTLPATTPLDNLPDWMQENWTAAYGAENMQAMAAALLDPPPLDLCFKTAGRAASWQKANGGMVVSPTHIRLTESANVTALPGFAEGDFGVQNAAAGQPALWLNKRIAEPARMLDLCAAPGGKTLQLAAAGHQVTALDISENRLRRLEDNLARTGLTAEKLCAEAESWLAETAARFDGILLDAPCTATGTMRRHPDILVHRKAGDMEKLTVLQARLLDGAASCLNPGGLLAYGVCAVQPQEGRVQIADFLQRRPEFTLLEDRQSLPGQTEADRHGDDGFYTAILQKTA